jgi:hypothetical protein
MLGACVRVREQARDSLYQLLTNCIPGGTILRVLTRELLRKGKAPARSGIVRRRCRCCCCSRRRRRRHRRRSRLCSGVRARSSRPRVSLAGAGCLARCWLARSGYTAFAQVGTRSLTLVFLVGPITP